MYIKNENEAASISPYSDDNPYIYEKINDSFSAHQDHLIAQESLVSPFGINDQELNNIQAAYDPTGTVAILGLIVAFLGLAFQIHRRLKDEENEKISKIKSSFIETKGDILRIRNLMQSSLDYNAINATISIVASDKIQSRLPKLSISVQEGDEEQEDYEKYRNNLIDFFENEAMMQYIRSDITSEIRKTQVRQELLPDFNKIRSMLSPYEADMPLTISIISDIIDMIEALSKSYISVRWCSLLYTQSDSNSQFREYLRILPIDELTNKDIQLYISNRIFDDLDMAREGNIKPIYEAGFDILNYLVNIISALSNKEIKKLQVWDNSPPPDEFNELVRLSLAWEKLVMVLKNKVLKKGFYFSDDRSEELRLQHALAEVRIAIRYIIDTSHFLEKDESHYYLKKYPHLKDILA